MGSELRESVGALAGVFPEWASAVSGVAVDLCGMEAVGVA